MNKYTQQQIEDKLKQLASIQAGEESIQRTNQNIRSVISGAAAKPGVSHPFFYYVIALAAVMLIGTFLYYQLNPAQIEPSNGKQTSTEQTLTIATLNAVFQKGGQDALNDYFEKVRSNRQPRAETLTLQQIMKDLESKGNSI